MKKTATNSKGSKNHHAEIFARWLDDRFTIPGTNIRFGIDPIISLIPGVGDWLAGILSCYFILLGAREEVAPSVLLRMGFNVLLDILIGSIPLLGDIFDFGWKANTRNARLLQEYQTNASSTEKYSKWLLWVIAFVLLILITGLLILIGWLLIEIIEVIF